VSPAMSERYNQVENPYFLLIRVTDDDADKRNVMVALVCERRAANSSISADKIYEKLPTSLTIFCLCMVMTMTAVSCIASMSVTMTMTMSVPMPVAMLVEK
jgi:hypothetical protein